MKATRTHLARWSCALLVLGSLLTGACTEDEDETRPPPPPPATVYTCTATLSPSTAIYQLGDSGRMLVLAPGTAAEDTLERVGAATTKVQGSWLLAELPGPPALHAEISIETARISVSSRCTAKGKTVIATATSPATITDTTITVLQSAIDVQYIR